MAATTSKEPDLSRSEGDLDSYSFVERLADATCLEGEVQSSPEDQARLVKELYQGPRKCRCCINWVEDLPANVETDTEGSSITSSDSSDNEDETYPLVLRRTLMRGEGKAQTQIHSIEIRHAKVRGVLFEVFKGFDDLHPQVKYLAFQAPFRQFFWRWDVFEAAIKKQESDFIRSILLQLRSILKRELAETLRVSKELTRNGVITYRYLWTIFPPGELIYTKDSGHRFCILESSEYDRDYQQGSNHELRGHVVDWSDGKFVYDTLAIREFSFPGTRKITDLWGYPAKYIPNYDEIRKFCISRGQKFCSLTGIKYKSFRPQLGTERCRNNDASEEAPSPAEKLDIRIVIDSTRAPFRCGYRAITSFKDTSELGFHTGKITQAPVDAAPPGGHRPLSKRSKSQNSSSSDGGSDTGYSSHVESRARPRVPPWNPMNASRGGLNPPRGGKAPAPLRGNAPLRASNIPRLCDLQLLLCNSSVPGFNLREKKWDQYAVHLIEDVEWNTTPFENLVLPDGYKDLILSFVESQLKDGETFSDIINGKGGGLVILLSGDPGVGKTLTVESVAEKIHAPLYKMDLSKLIDIEDGIPNPTRAAQTTTESDIATAFGLAARWKAVLLVDECDFYLEKRSESSQKRNRLVARFLQEMEYYPSLLFLTTNRAKELDRAICSRIHLTINYPPLDSTARRAIWENFLERRESSLISTEELDTLAAIDIDGRRIRNVTKTVSIMAGRKGRGISFEDIKQVMRITEGMTI